MSLQQPLSDRPSIRHHPHNAAWPNHLHQLPPSSAYTPLPLGFTHSTHLIMPAQKHTHSLPSMLPSPTKTPAAHLTETRGLWCDISPSRRMIARRLALSHPFVKIFHEGIA